MQSNDLMPKRKRRRGRQSTPNSTTSPRIVRSAMRKLDALEYRLRGLGYREIGERLGVSAPRAYQLVDAALSEAKSATSECAETLKTLELQRLDILFATVFPIAIDKGRSVRSRESAITLSLKIMDRRAKLLGLDKPAMFDSTAQPIVLSFTREDAML